MATDANEDLDTIRFLQDKYPQLSFMFVCNKVDTSTGAQTFDARSCDESDSDEEETERKVDKKRFVFSQLQHHGLIAESESYDSCSSFYGISAQNVREDRRNKTFSQASEIFSKFEDGLLAVLEETIKRQAKQVVNKLIFLQMSLLHSMDRAKQNLPGMFGSQLEFDTAKSVERSLYTTLTSEIASEKNVGVLVTSNLLSLEEKFMPEALRFNATMQVPGEVKPLIASLQELVERLNQLNLLLCVKATRPKYHFPLDWSNNDAPFLRFLIAMKRVILDRTFNDFKRSLEKFLTGKKDVELHSRNILNPQLRYALSLAYGTKAKTSTLQDQVSEQLSVHLTSLVSKELRRVLSEVLIEGLVHAMEWRSSNIDFNVADKPTRKKVLELILSKFSCQRITHSITVALQDRLEKAHAVFVNLLDSLTVVNEVISNTSAHQLDEIAALYIPCVRHLVVQGFALQFLLNNGPLTLGPTIRPTKHGTIHRCTGWPGEESAGEFVVKVIEEEKVEPDVWAQTAVDLINTMEIQTRIEKAHPNLLLVYGWLIPEPGVLHVLMEKAELDVTTALQQGYLPLKTRLKIAVDVANGLKAIHSANYVHQDLKADSILLMKDGTAKINMAIPLKPFEKTRQGTPFHISLEMHKNHGKGQERDCSYDIYAFGSLLWVLCEGSGNRRPQAYEKYGTIAAMKLAVEKEIYPDRPLDTTDTCWELMTRCWRQRYVLTALDLSQEMQHVFLCTQ